MRAHVACFACNLACGLSFVDQRVGRTSASELTEELFDTTSFTRCYEKRITLIRFASESTTEVGRIILN